MSDTHATNVDPTMDLAKADYILSANFVDNAIKIREGLIDKVPSDGVLLCTRHAMGLTVPSTISFNEDKSNLILKWNKDNPSFGNFVPMAGVPILILLGKNTFIVGHYTDANFKDENGSTIMIYKILVSGPEKDNEPENQSNQDD